MSVTLQDAINATRNGDSVGAQKMLADILQADTENVQAWYLLALLVDSPSKKEAYLNRVLALDPTHEKAAALLDGLQTPAAVPVVTQQESNSFDNMNIFETEKPVEAQFEDPTMYDSDRDDSILPSWLDDDKSDISSEMLVDEAPSELFEADLPDWLDGDSSNILEEPPTLVTEDTPHELDQLLNSDAAPPAQNPELDSTAVSETEETVMQQVDSPMAAKTAPREAQLQRLNFILIVLSFLAFMTLIAIIVTLST